MMTLMSGKPTLHILISILYTSLLDLLVNVWFFVQKKSLCVLDFTWKVLRVLWNRWRSLNWKRRKGESLLNWQQRRLLGGNWSKLRIPVGSPFCQTRRHQVKAKKEASNGDEEEESRRICYANLTNKSCKCVSQLGRPTAVSIPPPHPPSPVPLNALQCLLPARFHVSQCLQWPLHIDISFFFSFLLQQFLQKLRRILWMHSWWPPSQSFGKTKVRSFKRAWRTESITSRDHIGPQWVHWKKRWLALFECLKFSSSPYLSLVFIVGHGLVLQLFSLCCSFRLCVHLISCRSTGLFHVSIWIVQEIENRLKKFEVSWLCKQHRLARVPMSCRIMVLVVCPCNFWLSILFYVVWSAPCRQGHVGSSQDQHRKRWSSCTQAQVDEGQRTEGIVRVVCRMCHVCVFADENVAELLTIIDMPIFVWLQDAPSNLIIRKTTSFCVTSSGCGLTFHGT